MKPVNTLARRFRDFVATRSVRWKELRYALGSFEPGTERWLIQREIRYGGLATNVPRNVVSPVDPRTPGELASGGMIGGDRMLHHGYAPAYAEFLAPFCGREELTIVEVGILRGSGLAIWCDLFHTARGIGLDIDLGHFEASRAILERRGAFVVNAPEVYTFDQLLDNSQTIANILDGARVDVLIDDGLHSASAIENTFSAFEPHLAENFIAFIEDTDLDELDAGSTFAQYAVASRGLIHVVRREVRVP